MAHYMKCDLHIHTDMSDGELPLPYVVDLFGQDGFDVIAITDHLHDKEYRKHSNRVEWLKIPFKKYLSLLWEERRRAWEKYEMLLLPGVELTNQTHKYHILGLDIKEYIDPDLPPIDIIGELHRQSAIAVACHPGQKSGESPDEWNSRHLWENHDKYVNYFDAWEVANRDDLYNVVGLKKFNYVASSDFHKERHLYSWKTLIYGDKNAESVKAAIRHNHGICIYLHRREK